MNIDVLQPGLYTTVQDAGRPGRGAQGIPASGAMDLAAFEAANRLVGNEPGAAALEITLTGPTIRFDEASVIALCGSEFDATIGGPQGGNRPMPPGESVALAAGETLTLARSRRGARAWLAVGGGIAVPLVLGSRSTLVSAGFGGFEGRPLRAEDRLPIGTPPAFRARRLRADSADFVGSGPIRIVPCPSPEPGRYSPIEKFLAAAWKVSSRSDRVGIRLEGAQVNSPVRAEGLPEGTAPGTIQLPPDGKPIVLGPDRGTTGGYPVLGTVITADLGRLAHLGPGSEVRFESVSIEQARAVWRDCESKQAGAVEYA